MNHYDLNRQIRINLKKGNQLIIVKDIYNS